MKSKDRRNSGRITGKSTLNVPKQKIINECLEPRTFWDDWNDYRDGFRNYYDNTKKKSKHLIRQLFNWNKDMSKEIANVNKKIKKKEMIRRKRK